MKKVLLPFISLSLCVAGTFLFQSCNKLNLSQTITWAGPDIVTTVPIVSDTTYHGKQGANSFTFNLDSMIKAKTGSAFSITNIDTVTINSCLLTIENPDSANNFANFENCDLNIASNVDTNFTQVALVQSNPDTYSTSLTIPVNKTINLKNYMYAASSASVPVTFKYQFGAKLRRVTTKALTIKVHVEYNINVKP